MSETSSVTNSCPKCGAALPSEATAGLCPRCLMAEAMVPTHPDAGPAAPQKALTPAELAPHFPQLEILESLGRGGMGVVYKARQKSLNRFVALKLLAPERVGDAGFAERFQKEAQALAALNHPHIVTVHDFGQAGGFYYLLMEFVDGVNLRQAMKAGRFTPEQALAVVPPVCEALQYAHNHGIVHRDIKPENLLLDREGRVMIADFGIAKMLGAGASGVGLAESQPAGTPQYMAPEQQTAPQRADNRADIYSLGVVLYEMLTGELPGKPIEPPSHKVLIDVRLDEVVLHALEREPERRYQQVSEVKTMVETIITTPGKAAEQPRAARPEGELSAGAPPHDPAAARRYAWEITIVGCGTIILIWFLLFALELPRFKAATLATGLIGLVICLLSWAGIWPFPSPLFPEPNFSSRNLRRRSRSSVPVAIAPEIPAGTGATKVLRPALLTVAWHAGLLLATVGFLVSVVPRFSAMFEDLSVALPALTLLTLRVSEAIRHGGFLLFPVLLALDAGICILTQYLGGRWLRHVWSALVGCGCGVIVLVAGVSLYWPISSLARNAAPSPALASQPTETARLKLEYAEKELTRAEELRRQNAVSTEDYEKARFDRDLARAELTSDARKALQIKLAFAETQLIRIKALYDKGIISRAEYDRAEYARDLALAELAGEPVKIAQIKLGYAERRLTLIQQQVDRGLITHEELAKAKLERDLALAELKATMTAGAKGE